LPLSSETGGSSWHKTLKKALVWIAEKSTCF
jgi:hypothetical protein